MNSTLHPSACWLIVVGALLFACHAQGQTFERLYQFETGTDPLPHVALGSDGGFYGATQYGGNWGVGTVFKLSAGGVRTTLLSFNEASGSYPAAGLVAGGDGNFYGTTQGGPSGYGTVFRITPAGALTTLATFDSNNGGLASGLLARTSDGTLYGTTESGGTVFKIPPGGVVTTLASFTGPTGNGNRPEGLVKGADGNFYGTSYAGGPNLNGVAYKVTPAGTLTKLLDFSLQNGAYPSALMQAPDGNFYGTTQDGGSASRGTAFRMTPAGGFASLYSFATMDLGTRPAGGLVRGSDGNFYGTTSEGGTNGLGTAFRLTPAGAVTTLATFNGTNGKLPYAPLIQGNDGNFRGLAQLGAVGSDYAMMFKMTPAGALTTQATFNSPGGSSPWARLVVGTDGNFYGATRVGGTSDRGTIYKATPAGALTTLASFTGTHGSLPSTGLAQGLDGNFYGTTPEGGPNQRGTIFKVTPAGVLTTLISFNGANGSQPEAGLVRGSDENFYGTTYGGGTNDGGTVFKVTPAGALTTLVSFASASGHLPRARLLIGSDGNFYGTTSGGGANNQGTVFKVTPAGTLTILAPFAAPPGGNIPLGTLAQGLDGHLYGTTAGGGANNFGTFFKVTLAGELTTLLSFEIPIGYGPTGLMRGNDGNFYGTTVGGGASQIYGTLFKVTPGGTLTTLYSFDGATGASPHSAPIFGSDGKLYGTADHIIYRLTLDSTTLPPTLIAPASSSVTGSPMSVSFNLPEAASAGTVKLVFEDGVTTRLLTLAASQESAGMRTFSFDPVNPTSSAAIAAASPIPNGTYAVRLSYQDASGNPAASSATAANVRIDAPPTSFASWQAGKFPPAELGDENISGLGADGEHDGIINVLEYALALQPLTPDANVLPSGAIQDIEGAKYLTLTFRRWLTVNDLVYTPQAASSPMGPWMDDTVQVGPATQHGDGTETVTFRDSLPADGPSRFLRLQVTVAP